MNTNLTTEDLDLLTYVTDFIETEGVSSDNLVFHFQGGIDTYHKCVRTLEFLYNPPTFNQMLKMGSMPGSDSVYDPIAALKSRQTFLILKAIEANRSQIRYLIAAYPKAVKAHKKHLLFNTPLMNMTGYEFAEYLMHLGKLPKNFDPYQTDDDPQG
ncbi:MAG: hypothetical protein U0X91_04660 [Spirosomataceae bacterium]